VSTLQGSIKHLKNYSPSTGAAGLKSDLKAIQADATATVAAAKQDFPTETSAVQSSVKALKTVVQQTPSASKAQQGVLIATAAKAVVTSVQTLTKATQDKCS
jgi:hypothetical protein